jgi:hypothetical protein
MQTLGLSDSTPKPENRLKSLFWPDIRHEYDADHISTQGFWVCWIIAGFTLVFGLALTGQILVVIDVVYFLMAGMGIRQHSKFAAVAAVVNYFLASLLVGFRMLSVFFLALLIANVRATWLSVRWRANNPEPPPVPLEQTFLDRVSSRLPRLFWPALRWLFYPLAILEALAALGTLFARATQVPGV